MNKFLKIIVYMPLFVFSACMVGPDFEKPEYKVSDNWKASDVSQSLSDNRQNLTVKDLADWWKLFGDEDLTQLIEQAIKNNFDLQTVRARLEQAQASLGVVKSGFWPSLDVNASYRERAGTPLDAASVDRYGAGATAAWEIDIFGGIRRSIESSEEDYKAALADTVATRIKVAAEVAQAYFKYRAFQIQLRITKDNLQTQKKTYEITKARKKNGFVSQLDVVQASAEVSSTNAQLPEFEKNKRLALHALELLVGVPSGSLKEKLATEKSLPKLESFVPVGVPAELLARRPDVIMAEHKIHSAVASIGVAKADLYPKFSITGTISFDSPKAGKILNNPYGSWSVGPTATWNIFQAGRTISNIKLREAVAKEAKISWQSTVFVAIKEVEDALVSAAKERERIELINTLVSDNQKAFDLSKKLYSAGEIEFLDLLVSQRALLNSQQSQVASRMQFVNYVVALYKSLGGGWQSDTATQAN